MAVSAHVTDQRLDAPSLLLMNRWPARVVAALFLTCTLASAPDYGGDNHHLPGVICAIAVIAVATTALLTTVRDPMSLPAAVAVAAAAPVGALLTAVAIAGPPANPNQTNALGAGVALCAFICVRGRVAVAWTAQLVAVAIMTAWGAHAGQGALAGFEVGLPNLAVLVMAAMFARIVRPAARDIGALRTQALRDHGEIAALNEHHDERRRQQSKLHHRAWPSLALIGSGRALSRSETKDILLVEAELRDSIRAPILDVPLVRSAARDARARGVDVELLDDHGLDAFDGAVIDAFRATAAAWLSSAHSGLVTVRVLPPGRPSAASIIAIDSDGTDRTLTLQADGVAVTSP